MGHATAEALVRAGITLVPYTFTGYSAGVAVANIGVAGIPVEIVGRDRRQEMLEKARAGAVAYSLHCFVDRCMYVAVGAPEMVCWSGIM